MVTLWCIIVVYLINISLANDCNDNVQDSLYNVTCNKEQSLWLSLAIQILSDSYFINNINNLHTFSYSTLQISIISSSFDVIITPHCVSIDGLNIQSDSTLINYLSKQWILNNIPWPIHHQKGTIVNDKKVTEITFNEPCYYNTNNTNLIILLFNTNFNGYQINHKCTNFEPNDLTIYDQLYEPDDDSCSNNQLLPFLAPTNWDLAIQVISDQPDIESEENETTNAVLDAVDSGVAENESESDSIWALMDDKQFLFYSIIVIVVSLNICGCIWMLCWNQKQLNQNMKSISHNMQQLNASQHSINIAGLKLGNNNDPQSDLTKSPQKMKYAQSTSGSTLLTNTAFPMLKPNETTGTEQCSPIPEPNNHCVPIERDPIFDATQNTPNTMISKDDERIYANRMNVIYDVKLLEVPNLAISSSNKRKMRMMNNGNYVQPLNLDIIDPNDGGNDNNMKRNNSPSSLPTLPQSSQLIWVNNSYSNATKDSYFQNEFKDLNYMAISNLCDFDEKDDAHSRDDAQIGGDITSDDDIDDESILNREDGDTENNDDIQTDIDTKRGIGILTVKCRSEDSYLNNVPHNININSILDGSHNTIDDMDDDMDDDAASGSLSKLSQDKNNMIMFDIQEEQEFENGLEEKPLDIDISTMNMNSINPRLSESATEKDQNALPMDDQQLIDEWKSQDTELSSITPQKEKHFVYHQNNEKLRIIRTQQGSIPAPGKSSLHQIGFRSNLDNVNNLNFNIKRVINENNENNGNDEDNNNNNNRASSLSASFITVASSTRLPAYHPNKIKIMNDNKHIPFNNSVVFDKNSNSLPDINEKVENHIIIAVTPPPINNIKDKIIDNLRSHDHRKTNSLALPITTNFETNSIHK